MEGVRGEHEHHNQQKSDKEEDKGWFAILLLQLLQPYSATCASTLEIAFQSCGIEKESFIDSQGKQIRT